MPNESDQAAPSFASAPTVNASSNAGAGASPDPSATAVAQSPPMDTEARVRDLLTRKLLPLLRILGLQSVPFADDVLRVLFVGGLLAVGRDFIGRVWEWFKRRFVITAVFQSGHETHDWVSNWLAGLEGTRRAKDFIVLSHTQQEDEQIGAGYDIPLKTLPANDTTNYFSYRPTSVRRRRKRGFGITLPGRRLVWFSSHRDRELLAGQEGSHTFLHLNMLTFWRRDLEDLIIEARADWVGREVGMTGIYMPDDYSWRRVALRPKRPLSTVVLDEGQAEMLVTDARSFLQNEAWYASRGIPFRRGYLLHGPPGAGKTSLIIALAGVLNLPIYIFSLTHHGVTDQLLLYLSSRCPETCILLIEDIDAAFAGRKNIVGGLGDEKEGGGRENEKEKEKEKGKEAGKGGDENRVSFSGLLNLIDGAGAPEGRLLFATTNHIERLDPALIRPGRIDIKVQFDRASKTQVEKLFVRLYTHRAEEDSAKRTGAGAGASAAERRADVSSSRPSLLLSDDSELDEPRPPTPDDEEDEKRQREAEEMYEKRIRKMAKEFATHVPERKFSMATLQGFFMKRKETPEEALRDVRAWVERDGHDDWVGQL